MKLTGKQKGYLRGLGHALNPVVILGKNGMSEGLVASIDKALLDHELIKVRFGDGKEEKEALAQSIASSVQGELVGIIGHVAIFFRPHPEMEKRRIHLPS